MLSCGVLGGGWVLEQRPWFGAHQQAVQPAPIQTSRMAQTPLPDPREPLLDSGYALGGQLAALGNNPPLSGEFQWAEAPADVGGGSDGAMEPNASATAEAPSIDISSAEPDPSQLAGLAPLPPERPNGLLPQAQRPLRSATRALPRQPRTAALSPTAPADNRNFFEKLFGMSGQPKPSGPVLAYAAPQDEAVNRSLSAPLTGLITPRAAAGTAVYDISARAVFLPNGEKLEAHSGLGDKMDDPRFIHVRMKGATPPHTYHLTLRESLFHGVQAIRMHPVEGSQRIHGRAGLLVHSYMLGPRGDSNGCVSVRDYDRFLKAYMRGEVKRLVVVAGR